MNWIASKIRIHWAEMAFAVVGIGITEVNRLYIDIDIDMDELGQPITSHRSYAGDW